jgi:hypothetical protein
MILGARAALLPERMVDVGFEPTTFALSPRHSPAELIDRDGG